MIYRNSVSSSVTASKGVNRQKFSGIYLAAIILDCCPIGMVLSTDGVVAQTDQYIDRRGLFS